MLLPRHDAAAVEPWAIRPWPSVLVTWGPGGVSEPHAHHCWHVLIGLDAPLVVREREAGRGRRAWVVVTRPDARHAIDARSTRTAILFVEPESELGARLAAGLPRRAVVTFDGDVAAAMVATAQQVVRDPSRAAARVDEVLTALGATTRGVKPRHPGVRRVLRYLRESPPDADASLEVLAALAQLSPGRLMHVFTEAVGVPLRPYLRWLKVERAATALAAGAKLTDAAVTAGFSDAAHMTRTFRSMFGVTPSSLRRRSQSVQDR
ncbi:MAG: helix-turn-helix transcriptional regulator [Labilithrix sp.]|nr:helix-turn-helix transcriptional regulator [Labilithrix sp.]